MRGIIKISDGLGNQMFQYAFARKLQTICGNEIYLDTRFINNEDIFKRGKQNNTYRKCSHRIYGLEHFKITLPVADDSILWHWNYMRQKNCIEKIESVLAKKHLWIWQYRDENEVGNRVDIGCKQLSCPTYFIGYYFDLNFFSGIDTILKKEFHLKKPFRLPSNLYKILKNEDTVSIHVRRGDFVKLFWDISKSDYYRKAIQMIKERVEHPVYLIFSDDIAWVKENMSIDGEKIYISEMGFEDYEELILMKYCRHNIIANSTFSYWAAYLNENPDKIVICPGRWKANAIPKNWTII